MIKYLSINPEVKKALKQHKPVVALESTIISHGMPYPKNVETALECEKIIRDNGATPATIAIINGVLKIGLTTDEITHLGKKGQDVLKISRRDIAYAVSQHLDGATTVAATMYIASLANIPVFATGGIGGVHREATSTMDISADLEELSKTNVCVVCAGAKSILDLGLTMEYLETKGVLVIGYNTDTLPAFYTSSSDYKVNVNLDNPTDIANLLKAKWELSLDGGVLVTVPVPKQYSMDPKVINDTIDKALKEANKQKITGKKVTPFLLSKICDLTKGASLEANIQLVYNNCKVASLIACEYCKKN